MTDRERGTRVEELESWCREEARLNRTVARIQNHDESLQDYEREAATLIHRAEKLEAIAALLKDADGREG